jgi:hypothetical protein
MRSWLSRRERGGWSWAELSRRSGVPVWTLRWWQRRLRRASGPGARAAADTFVAVDIVTLTGTTPIEVMTRSGRRVTVPRGFDEQHLARLLQVLDAGC